MLGNGNCVDTDNFDGDISGAVAAWAADGCRYAIVGGQDAVIARGQVAALRTAGIDVIGVYAYLYWGYDALAEVAKATSVATGMGVPVVFLDCEREGEHPGVTPAERLAQLRAEVAAVQAAGLRPGIYTAEPFWRDAMADTHEFRDLPLWHAAYWYDLHHVASVAYGGWSRAAIHQYTAAGNACFAPDGSLSTVPPLAGINVGYNAVFPGEAIMSFTESQEHRIREITSDTIAVQFRALLEAAFTGGFTEADGTPLPVPPGVLAFLDDRTPSRGVADHTHAPGPVDRPPAAS